MVGCPVLVLVPDPVKQHQFPPSRIFMNKKKQIAIILFGTLLGVSLLFGTFKVALGAGFTEYERLPSGIEVESPVNFYVNGVTCDTGNSFRLLFDGDWTFKSSDCISFPDDEHNFLQTMYLGNYRKVMLACYDSCDVVPLETVNLEYNDNQVIFSVIEPPPPPPPGEYFGMTDGFATGTLAYIGGLVSGAGPYLAVIIGLPLAFWAIRRVIDLMPNDKHWFTEGGFEKDPSLTEADKKYYRKKLKEKQEK